MIEGFTLTAFKLKRKLKITVNVPDDYYKSNKEYPLVFLFDGDYYFSYLDEKYKKINLAESLDDSFITIGIHSPRIPEWRTSELNPYYNGKLKDVDISLSTIFFDYITNELLSIISAKYRLNGNYYIMGVEDSCISALYMLHNYEMFLVGMFFNPDIKDTDTESLLNFININYDKEKRIYLYQGENSSLEDINFYNKLDKIFTNSTKYITNFNENSVDTFEDLKTYIKEGAKIF